MDRIELHQKEMTYMKYMMNFADFGENQPQIGSYMTYMYTRFA